MLLGPVHVKTRIPNRGMLLFPYATHACTRLYCTSSRISVNHGCPYILIQVDLFQMEAFRFLSSPACTSSAYYETHWFCRTFRQRQGGSIQTATLTHNGHGRPGPTPPDLGYGRCTHRHSAHSCVVCRLSTVPSWMPNWDALRPLSP